MAKTDFVLQVVAVHIQVAVHLLVVLLLLVLVVDHVASSGWDPEVLSEEEENI